MRRRRFLATSAGLVAAPLVGGSLASQVRAADGKRHRVAVIGHTGRGNYGHGLDTVWLKIPETEIVAVADADPAGLEGAKKKLAIEQGFADYREMLKSVRPEFVAVGPRHVDQHADMILASIEAGVRGIYVEKPFCRTPAEADAIVAACTKSGAKLAVAHRNRYHPTLQAIDKLIADGGLGKLLEIRGRGKSDRRGGGEDLWVLGTHVLNLIAYFGGAPQTCSAVVRQSGKPAVKADVREGAEGLGPLVGDEISARFEMQRGMIAHFASKADDGTGGAAFGLQLVGSEGIVDIKCDVMPPAHLIPGNPYRAPKEPQSWVPITSAGVGQPEPRTDLKDYVAAHVGPVRDLMAAVAENREPLCGMHEGAQTVEMVCAVFESHRQGGKAVPLPLLDRGNPLAKL
jgi:predicted dehydrogenase